MSEHVPLAHSGASGATLERVRLDDGATFVLKHVEIGGDWLGRASGDDGREARLWLDGAVSRLPAGIDTAMVAVERGADGYCLVMRDVSADLLGDRPLTHEQLRHFARAAAAMHRAFVGRVPTGLLSLVARLRLPAPANLRRELDGDNPIPRVITTGWETLAETVPTDIAEAVAAIHERPQELAAALEHGVLTLVHGDFRAANLGSRGDTSVILDWSMAGPAPPAMELSWMVLAAGSGLVATEDQVIEAFREAWGDLHDERTLRLSLLAGLAHVGCHAAFALRQPDPAAQHWGRAKLTWWADRARETLERDWSP